MLVYSQSASHFGAFVQSSDPLQGVMTCHTDSVTGLPTSGLYYKESGPSGLCYSCPEVCCPNEAATRIRQNPDATGAWRTDIRICHGYPDFRIRLRALIIIQCPYRIAWHKMYHVKRQRQKIDKTAKRQNGKTATAKMESAVLEKKF